ncbi:cytidylate kinase family protein [Sulfurospirillum sp. 1612]|uniref:cytidylate kinase family protein n=1 Tax=Sulfurospirillum sp. 1612 TaxID=3094835 RepID=UPI002F940563
MLHSKIIERYILLVIGLFLIALGISLITISDIGTSPISSASYVLSLIFKPSFGAFIFYFTILCTLLELLILRKDFKKKNLIQVSLAVIFGYFIDFSMGLLSSVNPTFYAEKVSFVVLGSFLIALGVYLEVSANVLINPGESIVKTLATKTGIKFGTTKLLFDSSLVLIAISFSLFYFGEIRGIREGTIISAILTGLMIKMIDRAIKYIKFEEKIKKAFLRPHKTRKFDAKNQYVITISHQLGSGGSYIGKQLSQKLAIPFVDRTLLKKVADFFNISEKDIEHRDERVTSFWEAFKNLQLLDDPTTEIRAGYLPTDRELFELESKFIAQIAAQSSAIFLGRGSYHILRHHKRCLKVFLYAPKEDRIQRISQMRHVSITEATKIVEKDDLDRNIYLETITGRAFPDINVYDLCINTSSVGLKNASIMIQKSLESKLDHEGEHKKTV